MDKRENNAEGMKLHGIQRTASSLTFLTRKWRGTEMRMERKERARSCKSPTLSEIQFSQNKSCLLKGWMAWRAVRFKWLKDCQDFLTISQILGTRKGGRYRETNLKMKKNVLMTNDYITISCLENSLQLEIFK